MRLLINLTLLTLLFAPLQLAAADASATLIVATRHVPPFAIKQDDGNWQGISIELWRTVADRLGLEYRFQEMGLKEMLTAVEQKEVGAAVAAITITSERERHMDFTHPFMSSGLGIAVPNDSGGGFAALLLAGLCQGHGCAARLIIAGRHFGLVVRAAA